MEEQQRPPTGVRAPWPDGWRAVARVGCALLLLIAGLVAFPPAMAATRSTFDHYTTGYELVGQHRDVPCESCHVGGVFKGTPKDCASCHSEGSRIAASVKPVRHILSGADCSQCHTPVAWKPVALFNHVNVIGSCASCHNGTQSRGKGPTHIPTTLECSSCHVISMPWTASTFSHAGITGNCAQCHDGVHAPGKPATHLPTAEPCETCHSRTNFVSWAGTAMNHAGITQDCQACHETGMSWYGVKMVDRPTSAQDALHPTATSPGGADCATCHFGTAVGDFNNVIRPKNHIPFRAGVGCGSCHTLTNFGEIPTLANIHLYAPSTTTNCAECHGASAASYAIPAVKFAVVGMPANHVPTTQSCEACHVGAGSSIAATPVPNGAKFTNSAMSHSGITTGCAGCHGPTITGSSFYGISKIVVMPPSSTPGTGSHIPSGTTCESCHLASTPAGFVPANATVSAPGTKFATPAPTTAMIHTGVTANCAGCHEAGKVWMGMASYPISPASLTTAMGVQYTGFNTRPTTAGSTYSIADAAHATSGDCSNCHGTNTNYFSGAVLPSNHIPFKTGTSCGSCHAPNSYSQMPTLANIHLYAPSTTTNCGQCHGANAASFAIPANNFSIVAMPANHVPTTQSCEACHVGAGSSIAATPVPNGAKFTNSAMSHSGITTGCATCHGPTITGSSFYGISKITVMPPSSTPGVGSHIPSGTTCESCHLASMPAGFVPANATVSAPGTRFATPAPTTAMIHTGVTANCAGCHEAGNTWMGASNYPITPGALTGSTATQYMGFNTRPTTAGSTFSIVDSAHPGFGDCSSCHGTNTNYFSPLAMPSNHIPFKAGTSCGACHTTTNFAQMPTLANIHLYAPSTTTNCSQCHGANAASFAIPATNFSIVGMPANHVPTTQSCEACHVGAGSSIAATPVPNGAKFTNSAMSHAGITTGCATCHGPTITGSTFVGVSKIVVMPPSAAPGVGSHIPSGTTCESCHLAAAPAGLVPASATLTAPGTKFATPAPTTAMIHAGITGNCAGCHEAGYVWIDAASYPISPTTLSTNTSTQYTGFNTRPTAAGGTYAIADSAHTKTGDCAGCHGTNTNYFSGAVLPANHIPFATGTNCNSCHTTTNFAQVPTLANIHLYAPSTTTNCAQCHGANAASFAIPANNFSIVGMPANHVPTTQSCEACHVGAGSSIAATPVPNGAKFANSAMSHTGITSGCATCHGPTITGSSFYGISKITVMPPSSTPGTGSHIPSGTACETCHLASMPAALVPGNATTSAPGTKFASPAPTTAMIHTGITTNCAGCHEAGYLWMGVSNYPISPTTLSTNTSTQYTGFNTRPTAAGSAYAIADAAHATTGDCSSCHGTNTTYFAGTALPSNHIPLVNKTCSTCHTTAGSYAVYTSNLTTLHSMVATTCHTCHADGAGPFAGATGFSIVQMSTRGAHIPITDAGVAVECSGCHKLVTSFAGTIMSHAAIGDSGTSAAGNSCDACHEYGMSTKWYGLSTWQRKSASHYYCAPGGKTVCSGGGADCTTGCHQHSVSSKYAVAPAATVKKRASATQVPSSPPAPVANPATPVPGLAAGASPGASMAGGRSFDHATTSATCVSCHNGVTAPGKPAQHVQAGNDCDRCHTTSMWKPAVYDHGAVLGGTCATCHNGITAIAKPAAHVSTIASCDSCHYVVAWQPVRSVAPRKRVAPAPAATPRRAPATPVPPQ